MGAFIEGVPSATTTRTETDRVLRSLATVRAKGDHELGLWLLHGFRLSVHALHGYASFREYADRLFGFSGRMTEERLRVAGALEHLPVLAAKMAAGEIIYSIVREVTRVATPDTEAEWMAAVENRRAAEVERMVSGRERGERPSDPVRPEAERHRVRFELDAATHALLLQARQAATARSGGTHLSDDELVGQLARALLAQGSSETEKLDQGRAPYQIALTVCEACGAATQDAGGRSTPVDEVTVAVAKCDAQHIGRVDGDQPARATQTVTPATRRMVIARQRGVCAVPGCCNPIDDIHHVEPQADGGDHQPKNLAGLCGAHHRPAHDGRLIIRGSWTEGLTFEHADGRPYGSPATDGATSKKLADVYDALRALDFRQTDARRMIDAIRAHVGADVSMEDALKLALRHAAVPGVREAAAEYAPAWRVGAAVMRAPTWAHGERLSAVPHESPPVRSSRSPRAPTWAHGDRNSAIPYGAPPGRSSLPRHAPTWARRPLANDHPGSAISTPSSPSSMGRNTMSTLRCRFRITNRGGEPDSLGAS